MMTPIPNPSMSKESIINKITDGIKMAEDYIKKLEGKTEAEMVWQVTEDMLEMKRAVIRKH